MFQESQQEKMSHLHSDSYTGGSRKEVSRCETQEYFHLINLVGDGDRHFESKIKGLPTFPSLEPHRLGDGPDRRKQC